MASVAGATPAVAAIVLAAGRSTRAWPRNKLLASVGGRPLVVRTVDTVLATRASKVIVVVGYQADRIRVALAGRPVDIVENLGFEAGLSTSIRAGLAALPPDVDGAMFVHADMPRLLPLHLDRLIDAFAPSTGAAIWVPTFRSERGSPVLWARRLFADLVALSGDTGGRSLFARHAPLVAEVDMADDGVVADADTGEALATLSAPGETSAA
jgi:molybdenum cofactor cytidylyltransferase